MRGSSAPRLRAWRRACVDGGGVGGGDFAGDIADAVGALHHGDAAFGEGVAVPLFERERFELHDQPQQPDLELFRGPGVRGLNRLVVDRRPGWRLR